MTHLLNTLYDFNGPDDGTQRLVCDYCDCESDEMDYPLEEWTVMEDDQGINDVICPACTEAGL